MGALSATKAHVAPRPPKPILKVFTMVFFLFFCFFFYEYIIAHTFKNIKTLSPGTNILGVPGKKQKEIPN